MVVALGLAWAVPALFGNAPLRNVGRRIPGTGAMVTLAVGIVALASLGRAILDGRARRAERRRQQGPPADDRR